MKKETKLELFGLFAIITLLLGCFFIAINKDNLGLSSKDNEISTGRNIGELMYKNIPVTYAFTISSFLSVVLIFSFIFKKEGLFKK